MALRFEASLDGYLAGILFENLCRVLKQDGFHETLRLAEPHVSQFQKGPDLLTVQAGHVASHRRSVAVESETVDVNPLVGAAARATIAEVCDKLLGAIPWLDRGAVKTEIDAHLSRLMGG